jgi:HSP20 family molecular chaperone IbpA
MSRLPLFANPLFLGFEDIERAFELVSKGAAEGYPPYNVEQHADGHLRIVVAVAGFSPEELSVLLEGKRLVIRGKRAEDDQRQYLHRGIAMRQFQRSFVLADGIEVTGASLDDDGLLRVELERPLEETRVRSIEIASGTGG